MMEAVKTPPGILFSTTINKESIDEAEAPGEDACRTTTAATNQCLHHPGRVSQQHPRRGGKYTKQFFGFEK